MMTELKTNLARNGMESRAVEIKILWTFTAISVTCDTKIIQQFMLTNAATDRKQKILQGGTHFRN